MDPRPVGVFDSGVGALTVLHECLVTMPHEDFVYQRIENAGGREGVYGFLTTGDPELFRTMGKRFLQLPIGEVEQVSLTDLEKAAA